ncbi:hypothetical protein GCM10017771_75030 [Streptomyces capitiformicae]|uniref:Right handed beta helix domain-containing protein n=2 Tax=Streptomyces capitiformicae TaxID=2014920 RepID=A0A918ZI47_9ACTN|nr:hypothetical protein GCM10017771_75030 [Streptomyces capitiformicae]
MLALASIPLIAAQRRPPRDRGTVFVTDYATPQAAANAAVGKRLVFPAGRTYTVTSLSIPANCYVEGNGTTLRFPDNSATSTTQNDEILKVNGSGVTIDGLNFDGNSKNQNASLWSQHRHCVRIEGAFANTVVKNCKMTNIIGDGVLVYTQTSAGTRIGPNNTFSADYDNRQGVSVISGTDVKVFGNTFTNCTRTGMPAPIDIEPNVSTDVLRDVEVYGNTIIGGSTPSPQITVPGIMYGGFGDAAASNIRIHDNDISGTRLTAGVVVIGINGGPFNAASYVDVYSNRIHDIGNAGRAGVSIAFWIGANVYNNTINGTQWGIYNYKGALGTSTGNIFTGVATPIVNDDPHLA